MERPRSTLLIMAALSMALTWSSVPLAQSPTPMTDAHAIMSAVAVLQLRQADNARPVAVTVRLGSDDTVSFRLSQRVVTDIDLNVRGAEYSVPLQCSSGLHDVDFRTVELLASAGEKADGLDRAIQLANMGRRLLRGLCRVRV